MIKKLRVVGVLGSGQEEWRELSEELGRWLALEGYHLLTGGGKGVMTAVARAFTAVESRVGMGIGVVPTQPSKEYGFAVKEGYPNPWVDLPITSPLPVFDGTSDNQISRNHILVLSSDVLIALPGNKGTRNEVNLALKFKKPILLLGPSHAFENFPQEVSTTDKLSVAYSFISHSPISTSFCSPVENI